MKIAIVTDYHNKSWIGKQNYQLYRALCDLGHEAEIVHLVSPQGFKEPPKYWTNVISKSFVIGVFYKFRRWLARHLAKNRYDAVLLGHQGLAYLLPVVKKSGTPFAITVMDLFTLYDEYSNKRDPKFFIFNNCMLARAKDFENVAFISDFSRRDYVRFFWRNPPNPAVIPIGIPVGGESSTVCDVSKWESLFEWKKVVLQVGSSDKRKNAPAFFDAARAYHEKFGGDGTVFVRVWNTSEQLRGMAPDGTVFLSNLSEDDLSSLYAYASVFVFTSLHEGYWMPVVEARAKGLPVISTRISDMDQLLADDPGTVFVSDGASADEYARLISAALSGANKIPCPVLERLWTRAEALAYLNFFSSFQNHAE